MTETQFLAPTTVADAIAALSRAKGEGKVLAGGTDLLVQARSGRVQPALIVDLKRIPGMIGVRETDGAFEIGAATPGAALGEHEGLSRAWPGLVEAATLIGSTQIQGRASLGGNLCNSSPAADSAPALIAAGALCVIEGPRGRRELAAEKIQVGPGKNALASDEILVLFRLPKRKAHAGDAYLRLIPRTEMDIAVVGVGVNVTVNGQKIIEEARVALGAVAPTALFVDAAGAGLVGAPLNEAALIKLDSVVRAVCRPISDKRGSAVYRTKIAGVLARRAATIAYERACA